MARTISGNYDALAWVLDEIQHSLTDALEALNRFIDSPDDDNAIAQCITQIHQISGTVEMLNLQGAHLLAVEMLASAVAIRDKQTSTPSLAQDSLLKGLLLLPTYLKLLSKDLQDHPLRLIRMVNELRVARDGTVVQEQDLFKPSLSVPLPEEIVTAPRKSKPVIGPSSNKIRHIFQVSLLRWFKEDDLASLERLANIVHYLRLCSIQERTIILWWVAEGLIEAILDKGLAASSATKIKVGKLIHPVKLFTDYDEAEFLSRFPKETVYSLLLQIAHSTSTGSNVTSLKKSFHLDFFNEAQQQKIYSFSDNVLSEVNAGLLLQLQEIKEHADRLELNHSYSPEITEALIEQLSSMSNTLQMLDDQIASKLLQQQVQQFQELATQRQTPNDEQLMALANSLLHIETLLQMGYTSAANSSTVSAELQKIVISECQQELITVKESLSSLVEYPERSSQSLSDIASQLELIAGSLTMLNLDEATKLLKDTASQIEQTILEGHDITDNELSLFAEIIAATDMYMDNLQNRGTQQPQLLQSAQNILDNFEQAKLGNFDFKKVTKDFLDTNDYDDEPKAIDTPKPETGVSRYINAQAQLNDESEATDTPKTETGVSRYIKAQTQLIDESKAIDTPKTETGVSRYIKAQTQLIDESKAIDTPKAETGVSRYINAQAQLNESSVDEESSNNFSDDIDTEIAEIFIEEANELLVELNRLLPEWQEQQDIDVLTTIRRHFHTLKGSGFMAGADVIGNLAKAVEFLLNSELDDKQSISPEVTPLILDCTQVIPELLTRFTQGEMSTTALASELTQTAVNLLEAKTNADDNLSEEEELQQIFNIEATQHIATFKQALAPSDSNFTINKELLRAAHSLKGCANIAQVHEVAEVATQLDQSLRALYENGVVLDEDQRSVLSSAINGLDQYVEFIKSPQSNTKPDITAFVESLLQLQPADNQSEEQEKLIDPEFLVVFVEETDDLLSQYEEQVKLLKEQPDNSAITSTLHQVLATMCDNAQALDLHTLSELYQSLVTLAQHSNGNNDTRLMLFEQGIEEITLQIESLIQNTPTPDINVFKQQIVDSFSEPKIVEPIVLNDELFTIPNEDPELLEAYTEECAELLDSSGDAIKQWQNDHKAQDAVSQLQRALHTIKGGARLAGVTPLADLTHQIESLVFHITEAETDPSTEFFDILQRSQDRLADMHELLANRTNFYFAHDLVAEIASFSNQVLSIPAQQSITSISSSNAGSPVESNAAPQHAHSEQIRVRADLLDFLSNFAGEVNISRDRVSQQNSAIKQQLSEMEGTLSRLQDQLRNLEIETETQILFRYDNEELKQESEFDPLELDRFSMIQQLSRGLTETVNDMQEISQSLELLVQESDGILLQQSRLSTDLQQGLMNTRLIPFEGLVPRFERIVRQTNAELGKQSELIVYGAERELDRTIIDRIVAPIEHILRNAIAHGIESADERRLAGKNAAGTLKLTITREGSEVLISLSDDGQGINIEKVRQKAIDQKLINPKNMPSDDDLIQLILHSGFSTADNVSQLAGRGVGMDVVSNEIRALKGRLSIQSIKGKSTTFNIRLPLTLSIMQALLVSSHDHQYAIPLAAVNAGERIAVGEVQKLLKQEQEPSYELHGEQYRFLPLSTLLDLPLILPDDPKVQMPLLFFRYGDMQIALLVDAINSNREIVLKSVGEQLGHIAPITGATILGDGQVVFILDIPTLVDTIDIEKTQKANDVDATEVPVTIPSLPLDHTPIAMVVDDSITMRKASGNLLKRHGFDVMTARDGLDGVAQLNEQTPDIILLDVEMPRMDGFEFATFVRNIEQYKHLPIIMITSRTGSKHRDRAMNIGVNVYMGKPYQEIELVENMKSLLGNRYPHAEQ